MPSKKDNAYGIRSKVNTEAILCIGMRCTFLHTYIFVSAFDVENNGIIIVAFIKPCCNMYRKCRKSIYLSAKLSHLFKPYGILAADVR